MKTLHPWIVSNVCVKGKIAKLREGQAESECDFGAYILWSAGNGIGILSPDNAISMKDYINIGIQLENLIYIDDYPDEYVRLLKRLKVFAEYNIAGMLNLIVDFSLFPTETLEVFLKEYEAAKDMKPDPCFEFGDAYPDRARNIEDGIREIEGELDKRYAVLTNGYVYLLRSASGYWKIGRTVNPQDRIKTFSVKLPFEVEYEHLIPCVDHVRAELELHERFASKRTNGEWFCLDENEVAYIKSLKRL